MGIIDGQNTFVNDDHVQRSPFFQPDHAENFGVKRPETGNAVYNPQVRR
jgi:hypothetical protein